jgi:L-amino acid N-acyltransferase YncA
MREALACWLPKSTSRGVKYLKVREATSADLPATTEIYNREVAVATSTFDTQPRDHESERKWYEVHRSARYPVIVAEEHGRVVAWAALSPWSPRGAHGHTVEGSLFVREGYRGKRVGTLLTRELVSRAASAGHHVLLARVETGNHHSRSLLLSHGFHSVGVMHEVGWKFGR